MSTIVTRAGKGSPLTNTELDANFTNLNTDKWETGRGTYTASGAASAASWLVAGIGLSFLAATYTDTSAAGTVATGHVHAFAAPTIAATNARTITDAATLYLGGAPIAGSNVTITRGWAAYVGGGNVYLGNGFVGVNATAAVGSEKLRVNGAGYFDSTLQAAGVVGLLVAPNTTATLTLARPTSTGTDLYGVYGGIVGPSTATASVQGMQAVMSTTATAYTLTALIGFNANSWAKGAGSTITACYGFIAGSGMAVGTANYGFYSSISNASTTWQFYGAGTAPSYLGGSLGVLTTDANTYGLLIYAGGAAAHPSTLTTIYGVGTDYTVPATGTNAAYGFSSVLRTAASAFSTSVAHFYANTTVKGATSTIINCYGFLAVNAIAVGTNNYGFYSSINSAATNWAFVAAGTAASAFAGNVRIGSTVAPTVALDVTGLINGTLNQNALTEIRVKNTTSGTAASAAFLADTSTVVGVFGCLSVGYTTNGVLVPEATFITTSATAGISVAANSVGAPVRFSAGSTAEVMRVTATGLHIGTATAAGTSGDKVIVMANGTAPSTSPAGVGQLYVESGALKFRGSSGTVTTVAPA